MDKEWLGWLSVILTVLSALPYYYGIWRRRIKPHVFTWFIWCILTAIGFAAQYAEGAGPGAWATGAASLMCGSIALLALTHGERHITRSDRIAFIGALAAIPCWIVTSDPLLSVILISVIDLASYYPTARKSYYRPFEEGISTHLVGAVKFIVAFFAMEQLTLTTVLYPATITVANLLLVGMILVRRRQIGPVQEQARTLYKTINLQ